MVRKWLSFGLLAQLACTGSIGGGVGDPGNPGEGEDGFSPGAGGDGQLGAGATGGSDVVAAVCPSDLPLGPVLLRRLSHSEYKATVRDLLPGGGAAISANAISLTADTLSDGFENRAGFLHASALLVEDYKDAAVTLAQAAVADLAGLLPCNPQGAEAACGAQFVETFGARAFRRPLAPDEKKSFVDFFNLQRTAISFKAAVQLIVEAFLQSPEFLYRVEFGAPDTAGGGRVRLTDHELGTRLSYLLWGTLPDQALFAAAAAGQLHTSGALETQARRMLADPRLGDAMVDFHRQWLEFDRVNSEAKDPATFKTYTPTLVAAIRDESTRFTRKVMVDGDATLKSMLTSNAGFVNAELAKHYGVAAPATGWSEAPLPADQRAGFLTRAGFLAGHARKFSASPPLRSVFIMKRLLCLPPFSPPADADLSEPVQKPNDAPKTNRQRFSERTVGTCLACHGIIDPIGFTLEHYDGIGRYQATDNGLPVDATGAINVTDIEPALQGPIDGGIELSRRLADSKQVGLCATGQWYQFAFGRGREDSDQCKIEALGKALDGANGDVREMLVALVKTGDFMYRPEIAP